MLVTGLSYSEFARITDEVSRRRYAGNIVVRDHREFSGNRFRATLTVMDSSGSGARRSASGRRGPWACWHAYRDVLIGVFAVYPKARIRTGLAARNGTDYNGTAGFAANYPATGEVNIGSQVMRVTMPECCECYGNEPMTAADARTAFERALAAHFSANRIIPRNVYAPENEPDSEPDHADLAPASDATCTPISRSKPAGWLPYEFGPALQ